MKQKETCGNCKWYASFEGVCCNDYSKNCSDFMSMNETCEFWEDMNHE